MMKEAPVLLHLNIPGLTEDGQIVVSYSWLAMAILIGLALAARFSLKKTAPTGVQNLLETVVDGLENFVVDIMGT
jgi:F0F1-type ATP synthase membrane subunit a